MTMVGSPAMRGTLRSCVVVSLMLAACGPNNRNGNGGVDGNTGDDGNNNGGDGNNAVRAFTESDITTIQPVEAVEQKYPLRVERCELRPDSGGAGHYRGGLGLVREVRVLAPSAQLSVLAEKSLLSPYGVCGGYGGAPNRFYVKRAGADVEPSPLPGKVSAFPLVRDDVVVMASSGGGGFGDPLERDPVRVLVDLAQGVVTPAAAASLYGVVVTDGVLDEAATAQRRRELAAERVIATLRLASHDEAQTRIVSLDGATARRLGVTRGHVVELVNRAGAPVRCWVGAVRDGASREAGVSPITLSMLGRVAGDEVEIRELASPVQ